jgi:DMSO/TMAO reductase YedYZ molybdopterin-dependent catalytic subunit
VADVHSEIVSMRDLPPGQVESTRFPIVGEQTPSAAVRADTWRLTVEGEVDAPQDWSLSEVLAMPQRDFTMDVHCVTGWSRFATTFTGVPLARIFTRAKPNAQARFVRFVAYSDREHDTSVPIELASEACWIVQRVDGEPLTSEHGGPLRVVTRGRYFYKSLKWVHRIILLYDDAPGYWERESAYHNNADPFLEERYDDAKVASREQTEHFRGLDNFNEYRHGRAQDVLIQAILSNWTPKTKDLRGLQLKACDFDGADLRGVDLRGANLTLSKFFRADLTGTDLTGADLEGVDFSGAASLAGARLIDVSLAATKFYMIKSDGSKRGPKELQGMILRRGKGLLEDQEHYLRGRGIVNET